MDSEHECISIDLLAKENIPNLDDCIFLINELLRNAT